MAIYKWKGLTVRGNPNLWKYYFQCDRCRHTKLSTEATLQATSILAKPTLLVCKNCVDKLNPHDLPYVPHEYVPNGKFLRPDKNTGNDTN